jgi:multiple sugar transport system substrate-binding protein
MGVDTYYVKLATDSAAANLPDIIQIDTVNIMDYATRGQLADLSSSSINRSAIDPNLSSAGELDGKVYGIPLGANAVNLIYNKVAMDQLGIDMSSKTWTWDELIQMAKDVKGKLGKDKYLFEDMSVAVANGESSKYEIYQLSQGKGFLHTPDGKFNIDKDTFVEFENKFAELRKEGLVPPADVSVGHKQFDPQLDNLVNGNVLMIQSFSAVLSGYDGAKPGQFALAPVPSAKQSGGYLVPSQFFAVSNDSKNKEEAAKFISWFVNDEQAGDALKFVRGPQVAGNVLAALSPNLNDVEKAQVNIIDTVGKDANPFTSRPKGFSAWTDEYTKVSQQIAFGRSTPEEAYDLLKKKYDEIVK